MTQIRMTTDSYEKLFTFKDIDIVTIIFKGVDMDITYKVETTRLKHNIREIYTLDELINLYKN